MIEIQLMEQCHVAGVAQLEKECFHDPWSERSIASELSNPLSLWYVAMDGEKLVGYVGSQTVLDGADMMNIAVDASYRRQGIAEKLVQKLVEGVSDKGAICLLLEVRATNDPAVKLYQKLGFVQVGRRPNYYRNPKEDALILRKEWCK
jgi:ribosomal-protein-alanine N-acetyltransferase